MPPNLGISTSYFAARRFSIYDSVVQAYKLGFHLIELGANHDFEGNVFETLRKIRQDFLDVTFTQHCYFPPVFATEFLSNTAEGLTPENEKVLETMFAAAKVLGTRVIGFHNGFNSKFVFKGTYRDFVGFKEFTPTEKISSSKALKNLGDFVQFALEKAKPLDIKVAIENIVGEPKASPTLASFADFKAFLDEFPKLNFLFDFGHAFISFKNPFEFFSFGPRIVEMHLDDVTSDRFDHRVLGTGILELGALFASIKRLPKPPLLILEHSAEVREEEILREVKLVEKYLGEW